MIYPCMKLLPVLNRQLNIRKRNSHLLFLFHDKKVIKNFRLFINIRGIFLFLIKTILKIPLSDNYYPDRN